MSAAGRRLLRQSEGWTGVAGAFDDAEGTTRVRVGRRTFYVAGRHPAGACEVVVQAGDVALARQRVAVASARNAFAVRVEAVTAGREEGTHLVALSSAGLRFTALVTRGAVRDLRIKRGARLVASIKATAMRLRSVA